MNRVKKTLSIAMAVIAMMTSCNKEDVNSSEQGTLVGDKAYLSINLFGTKANGSEVNGTKAPTPESGQDAVNDISIIYVDKDNKVVGNSVELKPDEKFIHTSSSYRTKSPLEVPGTTAKVFIIVNNYKADGFTQRFALPAAGTSWGDANLLKQYAVTRHDVNAFITDYIGQKDGKDNFAMVNYGVRFGSDGTPLTPANNGLVDVVVGETAVEATAKADAAANKNTIYVDRLASKVQFGIKKKDTGADDEIIAEPAGSSFFFQGWEMNATNRKMRLYTEHEAAYTPNYNPINSGYRKDDNYTISSYGVTNVWTGYEENFTFLRNKGYQSATSTDAVARANNTIAYCPENTMEAAAQLVGATTKIVIKGNYVPAKSIGNQSFAKGDNYFSYQDKYYTLAEIQAAYNTYLTSGVATPHQSGIVKDMDDFMKEAGLVLPAATDSELESAVAALTVGTGTNQLNAETGIVGRISNAIRYFHQGVSYYDVLIRHDSNIDIDMALGRYGTVRNNWYILTLNKVSRPGTPWIPGGPEDPDTKPETPDDRMIVYLDVTMAINPWVQWTQDIEL